MQIVTITQSSDNGNAHIDDDDSHDDEESGLVERNRKRQRNYHGNQPADGRTRKEIPPSLDSQFKSLKLMKYELYFICALHNTTL